MLFDTPSFAPAGQIKTAEDRLRRVGVIDIGSNSVRMVVFDGAARSPAYFFNEKVMCGLGRGLRETGVLSPEGRVAALAALRRFMALAVQMELGALSAVATAAVREATDGPDFVKEVWLTCGSRIKIATGREEAKLSAQGVLLGWPDAEGVVCDIGGASMELARIAKGRITATETSPLGPLVLQDRPPEDRAKTIAKHVGKLVKAMGPGAPSRLFLVGGSWRAMARIDMARRDYPLHVLHEYKMTPDAVIETAEWLIGQDPSDLSSLTDTSNARLQLLPTACEVLVPLVKALAPDEVAISSYGLREGLLYSHMSRALRKRDPLLEAARYMEDAGARFPGFGDALYRWLKPLYRHAEKAELRLIRAACLLHDVSWRAHPDYRADVCFETATRANLGGLNHQERVALGVALLHRYKSGGRAQKGEPSLSVLSEAQLQAAIALGKTMRLGAMLSGGSASLLRETWLTLDGDTLHLGMSRKARIHSGEVVERRLAAVANVRGLNWTIDT